MDAVSIPSEKLCNDLSQRYAQLAAPYALGGPTTTPTDAVLLHEDAKDKLCPAAHAFIRYRHVSATTYNMTGLQNDACVSPCVSLRCALLLPASVRQSDSHHAPSQRVRRLHDEEWRQLRCPQHRIMFLSPAVAQTTGWYALMPVPRRASITRCSLLACTEEGFVNGMLKLQQQDSDVCLDVIGAYARTQVRTRPALLTLCPEALRLQ